MRVIVAVLVCRLTVCHQCTSSSARALWLHVRDSAFSGSADDVSVWDRALFICCPRSAFIVRPGHRHDKAIANSTEAYATMIDGAPPVFYDPGDRDRRTDALSEEVAL